MPASRACRRSPLATSMSGGPQGQQVGPHRCRARASTRATLPAAARPTSLIDAMHPFTAATHTLHFARAPAATHASLRTIDCWLAACFAQDGVSTSDSEDLLSDEHGPSPMQVWCALSLSHRLACTYITAPCNLPHSPHVTFCPHYCNKPRVRACIRPTAALLPAHGHTPSLQHGPSPHSLQVARQDMRPRLRSRMPLTAHTSTHPPTNQPTNAANHHYHHHHHHHPPIHPPTRRTTPHHTTPPTHPKKSPG